MSDVPAAMVRETATTYKRSIAPARGTIAMQHWEARCQDADAWLLYLSCVCMFYTIVERKWSMAERMSTQVLDVVPFHEYSHRAWTQRGGVVRQRHPSVSRSILYAKSWGRGRHFRAAPPGCHCLFFAGTSAVYVRSVYGLSRRYAMPHRQRRRPAYGRADGPRQCLCVFSAQQNRGISVWPDHTSACHVSGTLGPYVILTAISAC